MMRKTVLFTIFSLFILELFAQEKNVFLQNSFWESRPSAEQIKKAVAEGNDPAAMNEHSFDPVVMAILADAPFESIQYLLSLNNDQVDKLTHDGRTYIFWAASKGNLPVMKYMVDKGAKVDLEDDHGLSVINFAATGGAQDKAVYDYLIGHGGDLKAKTRQGANALC
jgi:ankyrin repeat protein